MLAGVMVVAAGFIVVNLAPRFAVFTALDPRIRRAEWRWPEAEEQVGMLIAPARALEADARAAPRAPQRRRLVGGAGSSILALALARGRLRRRHRPARLRRPGPASTMLQPPVGAGGTWANALGTDPARARRAEPHRLRRAHLARPRVALVVGAASPRRGRGARPGQRLVRRPHRRPSS